MVKSAPKTLSILLFVLCVGCFSSCQNDSVTKAPIDSDSIEETETGSSSPRDTTSTDNESAGATDDTDTDTFNTQGTDEMGTDSSSSDDTSSGAADLTLVKNLNLTSITDPYKSAPLVALVIATHNRLSPDDVDQMYVTVKGIDRDAADLQASLQPKSDSFAAQFHLDNFLKENEVGVPVLGLYPDHDNQVTVEITTATHRFTGEIEIPTDAIGIGGESLTLHTVTPDKMTRGFTWLNNRAFDSLGNLRWYGGNVYHFLRNGQYVDGETIRTLFGETIVVIPLPDDLTWHHDTLELPNQNLIMGMTDDDSTVTVDGETVNSRWDCIVEIDRTTQDVVNVWDMREFLDVGRATNIDKPKDWFHMNTLAYDEHDDSIIVSGRHQGVIKVSRNGIHGAQSNDGKTLKWILAPHMGWGLAGATGEGPLDTRDYLLTAVDENDIPYSEDVQNNLAAPNPDPDAFFWPIGQHGLQITFREGDRLGLLMFNNQASYVFDGPDTTDNAVLFDVIGDISNDRDGDAMFSQIIEYEIDEAAMTVKKRWSYGEHQPDLYSDFSGGTNMFFSTGNRLLISNGKKRQFEEYPYNAHVVEVTPAGEEVFHMEISDASFNAYRAGRVDLYHPHLIYD
ncbi:MAG: aryl-sulfate sulfotransferase [Deltaproteobacteria bacterium]|nr:aryl-sulfate sulfotransferase [Deltaproteobacteria bacterium]